MKTKKIYIAGMHCASCEKLLDSEFRKIAGIANIKINRADDSADIYYSDIQPHISEFKRLVKNMTTESQNKDWLRSVDLTQLGSGSGQFRLP